MPTAAAFLHGNDAQRSGSGQGALHYRPAGAAAGRDRVDIGRAHAVLAHLVRNDAQRGKLSDREVAGEGRGKRAGCSQPAAALYPSRPIRGGA